MRKYFLGAVFLILAFSCKNNTEKDAATGDTYPLIAVGTNYNGDYEVNDPDALKKQWEAKLAEDSSFDKSKIDLQGFEIIKGKTEGDAAEDFYMLVARSADGITKVAALLELKDKDFYFEKQKGPNGKYVYFNIVCTGQCDKGCLPVVKLINGKKYLQCTDCLDCVKTENEMS